MTGEPLHVTHFDPADSSAAVAVIEALATIEGRDTTELRPVLADVVDPDAIDKLCRSAGGDSVVCFTFAEYRVVVESGGEVRVFDAA